MSQPTQNLNQARKKARERCLQALYQWSFNDISKEQLIKQFFEMQDMRKVDGEYFRMLIEMVIDQINAIDEQITPHSELALDKIDPIEKAILRLSFCELMFVFNVPYKVVLNEAIELAKRYGGEDGHKFVNGVLDKAVKEIRAKEINSGN